MSADSWVKNTIVMKAVEDPAVEVTFVPLDEDVHLLSGSGIEEVVCSHEDCSQTACTLLMQSIVRNEKGEVHGTNEQRARAQVARKKYLKMGMYADCTVCCDKYLILTEAIEFHIAALEQQEAGSSVVFTEMIVKRGKALSRLGYTAV